MEILRLLSSLMALDNMVEKDEYRQANIRDIVRETRGTDIMTVFDLKDGLHNVKIEEQDKHKTAFELYGRVYEWNSMVMGYKKSPQILPRIMDKIFKTSEGNL
ncbi:pol polyprotein [Vairimorpha ceranae]|uniref:Pol polyprotein n=1 Tax=Vairimorpha ceranae TaxID=40302 RepID=A0A0F9WAZ7_9MICR|nr:pol polyprotein [Vairimorpha ceranae]KKO74095.1 pol polyprotein [Vairimorpha ceranae]